MNDNVTSIKFILRIYKKDIQKLIDKKKDQQAKDKLKEMWDKTSKFIQNIEGIDNDKKKREMLIKILLDEYSKYGKILYPI